MSGIKISVVKKWIDLGNNNFFGFLKLLPPPSGLNRGIFKVISFMTLNITKIGGLSFCYSQYVSSWFHSYRYTIWYTMWWNEKKTFLFLLFRAHIITSILLKRYVWVFAFVIQMHLNMIYYFVEWEGNFIFSPIQAFRAQIITLI